jgi:hypothetical protein
MNNDADAGLAFERLVSFFGGHMSGGHFDYQQYLIEDIAATIDELIGTNGDTRLNEFGDQKGCGYSLETIARFKEAAHTLRRAHDMAQRVDWLVSGDDGEDSFNARWEEEVRGPFES